MKWFKLFETVIGTIHGERVDRSTPNTGIAMLSWSITFFIIALIAGVLGFGGIAGAASSIAQILFFIFLGIFLISLVLGIRRPPV